MDIRPEVLSSALCIVGEGPIWLAETHEVAHVDIRGKRIRKIHLPTGKARDIIVPQMIAFIFEGEDGSILGGGEDGIYRVNDDGSLTPVNNTYPIKGDRYNDGKVGADGKLYMGTFSLDGSAAFYRMEHDGTVVELFDHVGNSNGLAWDEKKGILYYNDTYTHRTDAFDFDPVSGTVSDRRPIYTYPDGLPDGMTIDADGNLWTALWGGWAVVCIDPVSGKMVEKIDMPTAQPSCCIFAGDDLGELIITSASSGLPIREQPLAGATFAIRTGAKGVPGHKMHLTK